MDTDGVQSNRREEYVVKLRSTYWDVAKWSIRATDHVTKNDWYDQQFHDRGDDRI